MVTPYARGSTSDPMGNFSTTARMESLTYWLPHVLDKTKAPVEAGNLALLLPGSLGPVPVFYLVVGLGA